MRDLDKALADISAIRGQLAQEAMFRGFGPAVIAATGALALAATAAQMLWPETLAGDPERFLGCWAVVALIAAAMVAMEMRARSRRQHGGLADAMILNAVEQFLPSAAAGAVVAYALLSLAPETTWLIPSLWQILAALGVFASRRTLPRAMALVGVWYFVAGVAVLAIASGSQILAPWMMGLPFAVGQLLMAAILHMARVEDGASGARR